MYKNKVNEPNRINLWLSSEKIIYDEKKFHPKWTQDTLLQYIIIPLKRSILVIKVIKERIINYKNVTKLHNKFLTLVKNLLIYYTNILIYFSWNFYLILEEQNESKIWGSQETRPTKS